MTAFGRGTLRIRLNARGVTVTADAVALVATVSARLPVVRPVFRPYGGEPNGPARRERLDGTRGAFLGAFPPSLPTGPIPGGVVRTSAGLLLRRAQATKTCGCVTSRRALTALVLLASHWPSDRYLQTPFGTDSCDVDIFFCFSTSCEADLCEGSGSEDGGHGRSGSGEGQAPTRRRSGGSGRKRTRVRSRSPGSCRRGTF